MPPSRESARFFLAVWRPARFQRPLARFSEAEETGSNIDPELLFEQIYTWSPHEDVWGGIKDSATTNAIRAALIDAFHPALPPSQRGMAQLSDALNELNDTLSTADLVEWSECEAAAGQGEEELNLRGNTALSLYRHLRWVHRVFQHVPGASVTIR